MLDQVIAWVENKQCGVARAGRQCNHIGCNTEQAIIEELTLRRHGEASPGAISIEAMQKWAGNQVCQAAKHKGCCGHKSCQRNMAFIAYINELKPLVKTWGESAPIPREAVEKILSEQKAA